MLIDIVNIGSRFFMALLPLVVFGCVVFIVFRTLLPRLKFSVQDIRNIAGLFIAFVLAYVFYLVLTNTLYGLSGL